MTQIQKPEWLSAHSLKQFYDIKRGWAIYHAERGNFPKPYKIGGLIRWRLSDVEAFFAQQLRNAEENTQ